MEKQKELLKKNSSVQEETKRNLSEIAKNLGNRKLYVDKIESAKKTFKNLNSLPI